MMGKLQGRNLGEEDKQKVIRGPGMFEMQSSSVTEESTRKKGVYTKHVLLFCRGANITLRLTKQR